MVQSENENRDMLFKITPITGGDPVRVNINVDVDGKPFPFLFSDDMTKLAFSVTRENKKEDLYIVPFSMAEARTIGPARLVFKGWSGGAYNVMISWSHDGKKMAIVHEGDIWHYTLEDGKLIQITDTPENERWIDFSPDGNMISYLIPSVQTAILHIIRASGGPSKVLNNDCRGASWLNDSKSIAIFSNNDLQVISLDGQKTRHLLNIKEIGLANDGIAAKFSPDGKYLAFIGYIGDNDHCLIVTYSMETGKITRLADENIIDNKYGLVWSPDGKWLSYLGYENVKVRSEGSLWEADFNEIVEKISK
jgi:WD40 repeat protein